MQIEKHAALKACENYRSFLQAYLEWRGISRSVFAKQAGFGRGFPGDIISGRRRITLSTFLVFEKVLRLPHAGKKFFKLLVAKEEEDLFPDIARNELSSNLDLLRRQPWDRTVTLSSAHKKQELKKLMMNPEALRVFAAAGSPSKGASFAQIAQRTGFVEAKVLDLAKSMVDVGLLRVLDNMVWPLELHLLVDQVDFEEVFVAAFQDICAKASQRIEKQIHSPEEFYFASTLCVEKKKLSALKQALKKTVLQFTEDAISEEGDGVVKLLVALTK